MERSTNIKILAVAAILLSVNVAHADQLTPEQHDAACKAAIPQGIIYRDCSYEDRLAAAQVGAQAQMAKVTADSYRKQYQDALDSYHMIQDTQTNYAIGSQGRTDMCAQLVLLKVLSLQMKDAQKYKQWSDVFGSFCQ
jgi:hypothetical protein